MTFTATVNAVAPGAGTATGTVIFKDGATALATNTLSAGQASFTSSGLSVASHSITAVYSGDTGFNSSTSSALGQTVNKDGSSVALSSSANPSVFGQSVTFTANVSAAAPGAGTPTGTVQFKTNGVNVGSAVSLSGGSATSSAITTLPVGNTTVTAVYNGDASFSTNTSTALSQTVNKADTTAVVSSSANPSVYGQSVTFTATVSGGGAGRGHANGHGAVQDQRGELWQRGDACRAAVRRSSAVSTLPGGNTAVTAVYSGDSRFQHEHRHACGRADRQQGQQFDGGEFLGESRRCSASR